MTRDRRGKEQALKRFVVEERATRLHTVADLDIQFRSDAGELVWHYMKDLRPTDATQRLCRSSLKRNVQTTFQFDCLHKLIMFILICLFVFRSAF